jgi:hypothetical protein
LGLVNEYLLATTDKEAKALPNVYIYTIRISFRCLRWGNAFVFNRKFVEVSGWQIEHHPALRAKHVKNMPSTSRMMIQPSNIWNQDELR